MNPDIKYSFRPNEIMFFTYINDNNIKVEVELKPKGWSENPLNTDEYCYKSFFPIAGCFDDYSINKDSLKSVLNSISSIIVEELSDVCSDDDLKKILICLPTIIGEIKSDDSVFARNKRLKKVIEKLNIEGISECINNLTQII